MVTDFLKGLVASAACVASLLIATPAIAHHRAPGPRQRPTATTVPATSTDGREAVARPGGGLAGFISAQDLERADVAGEPRLHLGASTVAFRGFEVFDASGAPTGYFLAGDNGFVSIEEVRDPVSLARIERIWLADVRSWQHPTAAVLRAQEEMDRQAREG